MIFENLIDFKKNLHKNKRLLGLDVGTKTIGVALSDRDKNIATPKFIVKRKSNEKDIQIISDYILENSVEGIVVGLPLNSEEEETKSSNFVRRFVKILDEKIKIPVFFQNEYLTSFEAENFLIDDMSTKFKKTKEIVDKVAAHYILQDVLNRLNG